MSAQSDTKKVVTVPKKQGFINAKTGEPIKTGCPTDTNADILALIDRLDRIASDVEQAMVALEQHFGLEGTPYYGKLAAFWLQTKQQCFKLKKQCNDNQ